MFERIKYKRGSKKQIEPMLVRIMPSEVSPKCTIGTGILQMLGIKDGSEGHIAYGYDIEKKKIYFKKLGDRDLSGNCFQHKASSNGVMNSLQVGVPKILSEYIRKNISKESVLFKVKETKVEKEIWYELTEA